MLKLKLCEIKGMTLKQWDDSAYADELDIWNVYYSEHPIPSGWWMTARLCKTVLQAVGCKHLSDDDFIPVVKTRKHSSKVAEAWSQLRATVAERKKTAKHI